MGGCGGCGGWVVAGSTDRAEGVSLRQNILAKCFQRGRMLNYWQYAHIT